MWTEEEEERRRNIVEKRRDKGNKVFSLTKIVIKLNKNYYKILKYDFFLKKLSLLLSKWVH